MAFKFDIFGIRARRAAKEAERLAKIKEAKRVYQERKAKIDAYLGDYIAKRDKCDNELYESRKEHAKEVNTKCPKCGSLKVVNKIKKAKGEIHGSGSSSFECYGSSGLFSHFYSSSGSGESKIDGELDTYPVNYCNTCGHEWEIKEVKYEFSDNIFERYSSFYTEYLFNKVEEYINLTYDPSDITEKFDSLEEKQADFIAKYGNDNFWLRQYKRVPRYMLDYAFYNGMCKWFMPLSDEEEYTKYFGYTANVDEYSYVMPDNIWEIVKKLVQWEGEEE